jgi:MFS family permease
MIFSRNVILLLILRAVRWFLIIMPVITIFYREHGLTHQEVFIIQACFAIWVVLFEIPTGYFSDVLGRKKSMLIGTFISTIWLGWYVLADGFWWFLFAELILGLGSSFISGTDSAMLYDTLLDEWKQGQNKKYQWYLQSISSISEATASFLGGFLAVISLRLPLEVQFYLYLCTIPLVFLLREPSHHKHDNKEWIWKGITKIVKYSLHDHQEIKWLIVFSWIFGASTLVMTWISQYYFTAVDLPLQYFGVVWSILVIFLVPASFFAHRIEEFVGRKNSLYIMMILPIGWYILLSFVHVIYGIFFLFLFYLARGFGSVVLSDYVNVLIPSSIRATVLSIQALMFRFVFVLVWPIVGYVSDVYTVHTALLFSGILFTLLFAVSYFFLSQSTNLDI